MGCHAMCGVLLQRARTQGKATAASASWGFCGQGSEPGGQGLHRPHAGNAVCHRIVRRLPRPRCASVPPSCRLARRPDATRCARSAGLDAGNPQLGGLLHQPVHTIVGPACPRPDAPGAWLRARWHGVRQEHLHAGAAHAGDGGADLTALAAEQGYQVARLQPQHLHVAGCTSGQINRGAANQVRRA